MVFCFNLPMKCAVYRMKKDYCFSWTSEITFTTGDLSWAMWSIVPVYYPNKPSNAYH